MFRNKADEEAEEVTSWYDILAVGLAHSRGVGGVIAVEDNEVHSKGPTD
jgi:hypothetical protein